MPVKTDAGPLQNPCLSLCCDGTSATYSLQVLFRTVDSGPFEADKVSSYLMQLLPGSEHVACPGIQSYPSDIRFRTKHLCDWGQPFNRLDADTCLLWHVPNNSRQLPSSLLFNACKPCKELHHDTQQLSKRGSTVTDADRCQNCHIFQLSTEVPITWKPEAQGFAKHTGEEAPASEG